jgi:ubiquinone biosynthesis protein Coq4
MTKYIPWAIRAAKRSTGLMSYMYEENLNIPLSIVRLELNVECAPGTSLTATTVKRDQIT